jgi:hypothetical protein
MQSRVQATLRKYIGTFVGLRVEDGERGLANCMHGIIRGHAMPVHDEVCSMIHSRIQATLRTYIGGFVRNVGTSSVADDVFQASPPFVLE